MVRAAAAASPFCAPRRRYQAFRMVVAFGVVVVVFLATQTAAFYQPAIISSYPRSAAAAAAADTSRFVPSHSGCSCLLHMSDDWSNFQAMDDDDEIVFGTALDKTDYAVEDDSPEAKAAVGASLQAPEIERDAEPIQVPAGSQLELTEETVLGVLSACREELGTLFGYSAENRGVGITGGVDYVDMDGPTVIIKLKGRFWHQRTTVLDRVTNYLQQRIPEIVDVQVEDPWQLTDEANEVW